MYRLRGVRPPLQAEAGPAGVRSAGDARVPGCLDGAFAG